MTITAFTCAPRCDAGGTEADGGHVFEGMHVIEWWEESISTITGQLMPRVSARCVKCGLSAVDWTLMKSE